MTTEKLKTKLSTKQKVGVIGGFLIVLAAGWMIYNSWVNFQNHVAQINEHFIIPSAYASITPIQHDCIQKAITQDMSVAMFTHHMNGVISREENATVDAKVINATIGEVENCLK